MGVVTCMTDVADEDDEGTCPGADEGVVDEEWGAHGAENVAESDGAAVGETGGDLEHE